MEIKKTDHYVIFIKTVLVSVEIALLRINCKSFLHTHVSKINPLIYKFV